MTINLHCNLSEITELKYTSLTKIIILEENVKLHLEAFAPELCVCMYYQSQAVNVELKNGILLFKKINKNQVIFM